MKKLRYFLILLAVMTAFPLLMIDSGVLINDEDVLEKVILKINNQAPLDSNYVDIVQTLNPHIFDRGIYWNVILENRSSPCLSYARMWSIEENNKFLKWLIILSIARKLENETSPLNCYTYQMNRFDFMFNTRGIQEASNFYFDKEVSELNTDELLGIYKMTSNPIFYNPKRYPERYMGVVERLKIEYEIKKNR